MIRKIKDFIKKGAHALIKGAYRLFWIFPIKQNKIVFRSAQGEKYNCCPKYLCEYILQHCPQEFQSVWLFNRPADYRFLTEKGILLCRTNSPAALYHLATAKFIVDNHGVFSYFTKRSGQVSLNTWHGGGAYKKGFKNQAASHTAYTVDMKKNTDYLIASCEKFAKCSLFGDSPEKILPFGMARSDLFFSDTAAIRERVRAHYRLQDDEKLVLYAPTYRYFETDTLYGLDCKRLIEACNQRFGGRFCFAYRLHDFIAHNRTDLPTEQVICTNDYEDVQELIAAADVIVTDYSSLIWDAALATIPCFIFATDLAQFESERDFHTPISEWPFPLATDNASLYERITAFDEAAYQRDCAAHLQALGSFETGTSAAQTVDFMRQILSKEQSKDNRE